MTECPECGFEAGSPAGLASHRRAKHPDDDGPVEGRIAKAVRQLADGLGDLTDEQELIVSQALTIAEAIDSGELPAYASPAAHRELSALRSDLLGVPGREDDPLSDEEFAALLREVDG